MSHTVHALDWLQGSSPALPPVCVLFGNEPFLKHLVLLEIRRLLAGGDGEQQPIATFSGEQAQWRDVRDEVSTVSLFAAGQRRLVVVEDADPFVTAHRARLEEYVAHPKPTGVLVLRVSLWASNTRLYKLVGQQGLQVQCSVPMTKEGRGDNPDVKRITRWLCHRAETFHRAKLPAVAAERLVDLVGPEFGLLDQELAKLALFAGIGGTMTAELVRDVVGGWRIKTAWDMIDAAADGETAEALKQLDRLLQADEQPVAIFAQVAWSLRRFALAARIVERQEQEGRRGTLRDALQMAGVRDWPPGALGKVEKQIMQLGRRRAVQFYRWVLQIDTSLKGSHSQPARARLALEMLIARLARQSVRTR